MASVGRVARAYRLALWAYPRRWRERYADEVLGVLLEPADAGLDGPDCPRVEWREAGSLVGNGLLVRVEGLFGYCTRRTREMAAAGAAMMLAVVSVAAFVFGEWLPWRAGAPLLSIEGADSATAWATGQATPGMGPIVCATALVAGACSIAGRARAAQGWFAAAAASALATPLVAAVLPVNRPPIMHLALVFGLAMVAAAAPVRMRPGRRILVVVAVGVTAAAALLALWQLTRGGYSAATTFYDLYAVTRPVSDAVSWVTIPAAVLVAAVPILRKHIGAYLLVCLPWWMQQAGFQQLRHLVAPDTVLAFISLAALLAIGAAGLTRLRQTYRLERIKPPLR